MTPDTARFAPTAHLQMLGKISHAVSLLPDLDLGKYGDKKIVISCHMLARAIGAVFGLKVVDGNYVRSFAHSWLVSDDRRWVFDVYPVGVTTGPTLVDATFCLAPGQLLYKEGRKFCKAIPFSSPAFRRSVRRVTKELQRIVRDS